jgi:hypothetical protein
VSAPASAPRSLAKVFQARMQDGSVSVGVAIIDINRDLRSGELVVTQYAEGKAVVLSPSWWRDAEVAWHPDGIEILKRGTHVRGEFTAHVPASAMPVTDAVFVHRINENLSRNLKNLFRGRTRT